MLHSTITTTLLLSLAIALPAQAHDATAKKPERPTDDIVAVATDAGSFKTLLAAANAAGLVDALRAKGPITLFAPSDAAFEKLGKETIANLLKPESKQKLVDILSFHVVPGDLSAAKVVASKSLQSLLGEGLKVETGKDVKVGGAIVTKTDVWARNGVIHVIDRVMLPPERKDIVGTAVAAGSFKTLAQALTAAGLVDALQGSGPFTVFAPTDEAFAKLDGDTLADLLKPENKAKLVDILKFHVVSGRVLARDVVELKRAETLQGADVSIRVSEHGVHVGEAKVLKTDVLASNGVIHVIDSVILPPAGN